MKERKLFYTKCGVICHGLSEMQIVRYIKSKLHLKMEVFSKNNGENSIQINGLKNFLRDKRFQNIKKFADEYGIEIIKNKLINFKLFIIMDTDDCSENKKNDYLSKIMFLNHPLYEYIVPINNSPNLEMILVKSGIMANKIKNSEKSEYYIKTFPISTEPYSFDAYSEVEKLYNILKKTNNTNMEIFLEYCINNVGK